MAKREPCLSVPVAATHDAFYSANLVMDVSYREFVGGLALRMSDHRIASDNDCGGPHVKADSIDLWAELLAALVDVEDPMMLLIAYEGGLFGGRHRYERLDLDAPWLNAFSSMVLEWEVEQMRDIGVPSDDDRAHVPVVFGSPSPSNGLESEGGFVKAFEALNGRDGFAGALDVLGGFRTIGNYSEGHSLVVTRGYPWEQAKSKIGSVLDRHGVRLPPADRVCVR